MANRPKRKQKIDIFSEIKDSVDNVVRRIEVSKILDKNYDPIEDPSFWEDNNLLTFEEFCRSPEHMNFPILSDRQRQMAEYMLGKDPKRIFENERNIAVLAWGKGSLLSTEEIITADGQRMTMEECAKRNLPVLLFTKTEKDKITTILSTPAIKKSHQENCFEVKTSFGHISRASEDHKYLTTHGWKKLKELKPGDFIYAAQKIPIKQLYYEDPIVCRLIARTIENQSKRISVKIMFSSVESRKAFIEDLFATNGWCVYHSEYGCEIGYASENRKLIEDLDFMLRCFGIVGKICFRHNSNKPWQYLICHNSMLKKFVENFNISGKGEILNNILKYVSNKSNCKYDYFDVFKDSDLMLEQIESITPLGMSDVYTFTIPVTHNYLQGCLLHHNSGKDTMSALIQLYITYILLNMKYPQRYFRHPDTAAIDMINVASTQKQAQVVYFEILKRFVLDWQWLKKKWDIVVNGRYFSVQSETTVDFLNKVTITNDAILFPKNIRMFSENSEAESSEGKNCLCFVLDETDAFNEDSNTRSAMKIFRTLRTSAVSRFGSKFKGFLLSYPRSSDGFILTMYEQAKKSLNYYADKAATWEVLPREKFSEKTFEFEGKQIPIDFLEEFQQDPIGSKCAYLCEPPKYQNPFFSQVDKIHSAMVLDGNLFTFTNVIKDNYIMKEIVSYPSSGVNRNYVIAFDLGETQDSTVLAIGHVESDKVYIDCITDWEPDKKKGIKVSFENFENVLNDIVKYIKVHKIGGDHWNCLAEKTHVMTGHGTFAPISKYADESYSFKTGVVSFWKEKRVFKKAPCLKAIKTADAADLLYVKIYDTGFGTFSYVLCTPDHRFMLKKGYTYREAQMLQTGDELVSIYPKRRFFVSKVKPYPHRLPVYDISVPVYRNFVIYPGIVVHNSALIIQKLSSTMDSKTVKVTFEDYLAFRRYLYAGKILLPKNEKLFNELKDLQMMDNNKIDHPIGKHNDMVVACVIAFKLLIETPGSELNLVWNEGELVSENIRSSNDVGYFLKTPKNNLTIDGIDII